ncbi:MAG: OmpH family outer membrane protein [bacterium]|jgi:outer membrane protein
MRKFLTMGLVTFALAAFSLSLNAQHKTGVISIEEVIQLMPEYKKAAAEMSQFDSALQINYSETLKELNRQDSIFKADSSKMSAAIKTASREKQRKLFTELQSFEQGYQQQMQQKQEELMAPVAQKANQIIAEVAKANGFTHVFRKEALVISPDADDLLPLVKKKIEAGAAPKPATK